MESKVEKQDIALKKIIPTCHQDQYDILMMEVALEEARLAGIAGEVPVGAVLTDSSGQVLARAGNRCIAPSDPVGHAEIRVLRAAAKAAGNYRLPGTILYVTLEPCVLCAAAMVQARVHRVVFGAADPKAGALGSVYRIGLDGVLNHHLQVRGGILADTCTGVLRRFFQERRGRGEKTLD